MGERPFCLSDSSNGQCVRENQILRDTVRDDRTDPRPGGATDNSPALQRRESGVRDPSPGGTTEFSRTHLGAAGPESGENATDLLCGRLRSEEHTSELQSL